MLAHRPARAEVVDLDDLAAHAGDGLAEADDGFGPYPLEYGVVSAQKACAAGAATERAHRHDGAVLDTCEAEVEGRRKSPPHRGNDGDPVFLPVRPAPVTLAHRLNLSPEWHLREERVVRGEHKAVQRVLGEPALRMAVGILEAGVVHEVVDAPPGILLVVGARVRACDEADGAGEVDGLFTDDGDVPAALLTVAVAQEERVAAICRLRLGGVTSPALLTEGGGDGWMLHGILLSNQKCKELNPHRPSRGHTVRLR